MESYQLLDTKEVSVRRLLEWHTTRIVNKVNRKLSFQQKFKNPWYIEVQESIHRDTFIHLFKAIRDYSIQYGRVIDVERDRNGVGKIYTITFTHFGALKFHLTKLTNNSVNIVTLFSKKNKAGNSAVIFVSDKKPATMTYNVKKTMLTFTLSYNVENKYGTVCSF